MQTEQKSKESQCNSICKANNKQHKNKEIQSSSEICPGVQTPNLLEEGHYSIDNIVDFLNDLLHFCEFFIQISLFLLYFILVVAFSQQKEPCLLLHLLLLTIFLIHFLFNLL